MSSVLSFPAALSCAKRRQRTLKTNEEKWKRIKLEKRKKKRKKDGGVFSKEPLRPRAHTEAQGQIRAVGKMRVLKAFCRGSG